MKIAIASEGETPDSTVSQMAARAPYYLIFENGKLAETVTNPYTDIRGGAGFSTPRLLEDNSVDMVVLGEVGGNMKAALQEAGIEVKEGFRGKVSEALERLT